MSFYEGAALAVAALFVATLLVTWLLMHLRDERNYYRTLHRGRQEPRHVHTWMKVEQRTGRVLVECAVCGDRQWFMEGVE